MQLPCILMGSILTLILAYINTGHIAFPGVLLDILIAITVAYVSGLIIPMAKLADGFACLFKAKNGTFVYTLLSTVIYAAFYTVIFSFLFTALAIGFPPYFLSAVLSGMPLGFIIGYVVGVACSPLALKLTMWTCSKPMPEAPASEVSAEEAAQ